MQGQQTSHSRFDVLTVGEEAWAWDGRFRRFYFDGQQFWRYDRKYDSFKLVGYWRSPAQGWIHSAGCACGLCTDDTEAARAAA
jgi:hypothetical protein